MPRDDDIAEAGPDLRAPHAAQGPNPVYTKHDQDALTARENIWRAHGMPEETQASKDANP
jgi:hypothetical protein